MYEVFCEGCDSPLCRGLVEVKDNQIPLKMALTLESTLGEETNGFYKIHRPVWDLFLLYANV